MCEEIKAEELYDTYREMTRFGTTGGGALETHLPNWELDDL